MAINFTTNVAQYTNIHRTVKAKQFMEYTSKKQLQDAEVLTDKELKFVTSIKGTFGFALHNDGRYMAVTIYRPTAEKKYNFLVLDLENQAIAEVGSIKIAKAEIMELVEQENQPEADEQYEETEEIEETDEDVAAAVQNIIDETLNAPETDDNKSTKKSNKKA